MSIEWKDETSYQRGERGRVEPSTWEAELGPVRVVVTQYVGYGKEWVCHCHTLDIRETGLMTEDLAEAKTAALQMVKREVERKIAGLTRALLALEQA